MNGRTTIQIMDWIDIFRKEYLNDYIMNGSAAVKFAVPKDEPTHKEVLKQLRECSVDSGYVAVSVDAAETKVHMIDKVFHSIAKQIDWDDLAAAFLRTSLADIGLNIPEDDNSFDFLTTHPQTFLSFRIFEFESNPGLRPITGGNSIWPYHIPFCHLGQSF